MVAQDPPTGSSGAPHSEGSSPRPGVADNAGTGNGASAFPFVSPAAAFRAVGISLREAVEYGAQLLSLQFEQIRLTATRLILFAMLGVIALLVASAIVVTSAVLICVGLAGAVSAALSLPGWVGALIVGVVMVALVFALLIFWVRSQIGAARRQLKNRLAQRSQKQREEFGHDAHEYAATAPPTDASKN
jgi:uncharacterized membrane protein